MHDLDDRKSLVDSSSSSSKVIPSMDVKTSQSQQASAAHDPHQQPLRCPRCDSSNTKFCYYNNYSLSQPRHFCKACKRYWTRGGTLRNVPVGGGCRKNKRVRRQPASNGGDSISSAASGNPSVRPPQMDLSQASSHIGSSSPLFYGHLPTNPLELNFPFSNFRVSGSDNASGFDRMSSGLGLGFSSGLMGNSEVQLNNNGYNKNGFKQIQDVISASSSFPGSGNNNSSMFFGSSTSAMASLLATGLQHQKFVKDTDHQGAGNNGYPCLMHNYGNHEVKLEGENRLQQWNPSPEQDPNPNPNHVEQINNSSSDPASTSFLWNSSNVSAWFDPSNMGSSVPSLI